MEEQGWYRPPPQKKNKNKQTNKQTKKNQKILRYNTINTITKIIQT